MNTVKKEKHPAWVKQLEKLINKTLQLDEETLISLGYLKDKIIAFEFLNTRLILFIFPTEQGLVLETNYQEKPDVLIKGTPSNFIMMIAASGKNSTELPSDMQIIGDVSLVQRFQQIMQSMEIDLEEPLSRWVGDTTAYQLGRIVRGSTRYIFNTGKTLTMDMSEYLRFEIEMLPDDLLVEEFCNDVEQLREDVDRFTQHLNKIESQIKNRKAE